MAQKTLFKFLSTFSKSEFERFEDMIKSPYFNKRNDLVRFVGYLRECYPEMNDEKLSYREVYKRVYGEGRENIQVVKNLFNRMLDLCERFIMQTEFETDDFTKTIALAKGFKKKEMMSAAVKLVDKKINENFRTNAYTADMMKKQYDYFELKHELTGEVPKEKIINNNKRFSASFRFFLISILRIANDYYAQSFVEQAEETNPYMKNMLQLIDFEKILELIKAANPDDYSLYCSYYYGLISKINDPDAEIRRKLKEISFEGIENNRYDDNLEIWQLIFASFVFSKNSVPFEAKEIHEINIRFIDKGFVYHNANGFISENFYHNMTMQAVAAQDFKWVEGFINRFREKLDPAIRDDNYNFLTAYYLSSKGEYEKVIQHLAKIKTPDIPTNMTVRWLFIKTYYELGYYFEAESAADAFKKFIAFSGRVTKETRASYPVSLKFVTALIRSKTAKKPLKEEVYLKAKSSAFIGKKWVLEKMEELL